MSFQDWIVAHTRWKHRLDQYVSGISSEKLDPRVIEQDDQCQLGKWIHDEGKKYAIDADYNELKAKHAEFHKRAAEVVRACHRGDKAEARRLLEVTEPFTQVSAVVVQLISKLRGKYDKKAA